MVVVVVVDKPLTMTRTRTKGEEDLLLTRLRNEVSPKKSANCSVAL